MPVYEYVCTQCRRKFRRLVGVVAQSSPLQCPRCQSAAVTRQFSRFARVRSEDDALDSMADEMEELGDSNDPQAMRRIVRAMGQEMGEDFEADFEEMMEEESQAGSETETSD